MNKISLIFSVCLFVFFITTVLPAEENLSKKKNKKFGVTVKNLGINNEKWNPYNRNTRLKLKTFIKRSKNLTEKQMLEKWTNFVEKDLNMSFLNNAVVRGVILAPVGFAVDTVTKLKHAVNMDTKFDSGKFYLYKGRKF